MPGTIRYMGTKRGQAKSLAATIASFFPKATVIDVFAGTCSVARALSPSHVVWANDVHQFAGIIARAALTEVSSKPAVQAALDILREPFTRNRDSLYPNFAEALAAEKTALVAAGSAGSGIGDWLLLKELAEASGAPAALPLDAYRRNPKRNPYALFSLQYSHTYFGLRQCIELDSLRYAVDCAPQEYRSYFLWALFRAASNCAATPGHFAQYLTPRDSTNSRLIAKYRKRSIWSRFIEEYKALVIPECHARRLNAVYTQPATEFVSRLPSLLGTAQGVVYADPPYSRAQYSRYYHLLETLTLYDYPLVRHKGRYREARFNTDFSRAARVEEAMDRFVSYAAEASLPLFLNYPSNGLFIKRGGDLGQLLRRHYPCVQCVGKSSREHSTLGGAPGVASVPVHELLYFGDVK